MGNGPIAGVFGLAGDAVGDSACGVAVAVKVGTAVAAGAGGATAVASATAAPTITPKLAAPAAGAARLTPPRGRTPTPFGATPDRSAGFGVASRWGRPRGR